MSIEDGESRFVGLVDRNDESTPLLRFQEGSERSDGVSSGGGCLSERSAEAGSAVGWDPQTKPVSQDRSKSRRLKHFNLRLDWTDSLRNRPEVMHGDVYPAAFLLRDVVLGSGVHPTDVSRACGAFDFNPYSDENDPLMNRISRICRWLLAREIISNLAHFSAWIMALLTFVEPPHWCRDYVSDSGLRGCKDVLAAQGKPAFGDEGKVQYYPNSGTVILTVQESLSVEYVCTGVIVMYILLQIGSMGLSLPRYFYVFRIQGLVFREADDGDLNFGARIVRLILLFSVLANIWGMLLQNERVFANLFRLLILVALSKGTQREIATTIRLTPDLLSILFLLLVMILFYAWIGVVAFFETPEGYASFSNIFEGMWTLWICVTTANYPDVMMKGYNESPLVAFYFISFMAITFFFVMNIILATVVNGYNDETEARKQRIRDLNNENLKLAFKLLDVDKQGSIDREAVMSIFLVLNENCPEIRHIPPERAELLFALLDQAGDNCVSEEEFMNFGKVMLIEFEKSSVYTTIVESCFPKIYNAAWFQHFRYTIKSAAFEIFVDFVLILNAVVVGIQTYPELAGEASSMNPALQDGMIDTVWELFQTCFTVFYVMEMLSKILVLGWRRYTEKFRNIFDGGITVLCCVATFYVYYPNNYSDSRLIRYIVTARVLRLVRILVAMKQFQVIGKTFFDIIPAAKRIVAFLFCIMYGFSALGMALYGGIITRDPSNPLSSKLLGTEFANSEYWANNFNDMFSGMNVLFNLLVVNNWTTEADGVLAVTESKMSRFFFLAFHVFGVIVVNNLVVAFIIDFFLHEMQEYRAVEEVDTGEAVIGEDKRAYFDAKEVTGTKTTLSGGYVATMKNPNLMLSQRISDELKQLFTRVSSGKNSDEESHDSEN